VRREGLLLPCQCLRHPCRRPAGWDDRARRLGAERAADRRARLPLGGGIATLGSCLYCVPHDSDSVLVFSTEADQVSALDRDVHGEARWMGAAPFGRSLFCAPYEAGVVLQIASEQRTASPAASVRGLSGAHLLFSHPPPPKCTPLHCTSLCACDPSPEGALPALPQGRPLRTPCDALLPLLTSRALC